MWSISQLSKVERLRFENIVDMGLAFSAMMRVFEKGSKDRLSGRIINHTAEMILNSSSRNDFIRIHKKFCEWGKENIYQAERKRNGKVVIEKGTRASYGQIAKTLDVTLKVMIYYCHLPNRTKSESICQWLNAAVDNAMMDLLKEEFPDQTEQWPDSLKEILDKSTYDWIQEVADESRKREQESQGPLTRPEWEDIYLKRAHQNSWTA